MKKWAFVIAGLSLIILGFKVYPWVTLMLSEDPMEPVYVSNISVLAELKEEAKEKGRIDYLVLGDSVAMGKGSRKSDQGYSSLVVKKLKKERIPVRMDNVGVSGQTSGELLKTMKDRDMQRKIGEADLISLTIGGNDLLKVALEEKDPVRVLTDFDRIQKQYQRNLKDILTRIRQWNPDAAVLLTSLYNPVSPDEPYYSMSNTLLKKWNYGMKEVAYRFPATLVVNVDERLKAGGGNWLSDAIHPNDKGYRMMADGIMETIRTNRQVSASAR